MDSTQSAIQTAEQERLPTYRIHLTLYTNSAAAFDQGQRPEGGSTPTLAALPQDWREELAELRQAGAYFVPETSGKAKEGSSFNIFQPLRRRKRKRLDPSHLSDLPRPKVGQRAVDQRFGPIVIDWADRSEQGEHSQMRQGQKAAQTAASVPLNEQAGQASSSSGSRGLTRSNSSNSDGNVDGAQAQASSVKKGRPSGSLEAPTPVAKFLQTSSFSADDKGTRHGDFETGSTDVAFGVVQLFRDRDEAASHPSKGQDEKLKQVGLGDGTETELGTVLAVLAVPSSMTAADFLSFVEPAVDVISHMRMIREVIPNQAMILLKFRDASDAEEFHKLFNGQPYNSMNLDQICQVVYVTSVTVSSSSTLPLHALSSLGNSDPWPVVSSSGEKDRARDTLAKSLLQELPTCPVCLERMDSNVTGLMTITCQHTFHCSCLSKWGDSRCPVCRYSQTRQAHGYAVPHRPGEEDEGSSPEPSACAVCSTTSDLWVCLICAAIGCGRYKSGHAHQHFTETGHLYSLELETQRVWDYAGDGYVHRLIQNKADGKLVELPSASATAPNTPAGKGSYSGAVANGDMVSSEKIESIGLEYSYLLTSQLESQRFYYEDKIHGLQKKLDDMLRREEDLKAEARKTEAVLQELRKDLQATNERAKELEAEKAKADKRADKAVELARKFQRDLQAEQSVSEGLHKKVELLRDSDSATKARVADLEEQMRDLMFFVSAREKVQESGEMAGGDLEIQQAPSKGNKKKKGK